MISEKISEYTSAFFERFKDVLVFPDSGSLPIKSEDQSRILNSSQQAVLPARGKFSDWDIYCLVDSTKITLQILEEMRNFILSWKDFEVTRDYATCNEVHVKNEVYQAVGTKALVCMQCTGFIKNENSAPFVDIHILDIPAAMLEAFYSKIYTTNDTGYLDWSIIILWRKLRKTGQFDKDGYIYRRSIYPALSIEQKESADEDIIPFLENYFKDLQEFNNVRNFLISI